MTKSDRNHAELFPRGHSRAERITAEESRRRLQPSIHPNCRPRNAATLIITDLKGREPRLLMGQRHHGHKFMPGKFVFPGGRVEPQDYIGSTGSAMPAPMAGKLLRHTGGIPHEQRALALAHAALRETQEETGVLIGGDIHKEPPADFSHLTFLARAITPPRRARRFDTRFFAVLAEHVTGNLGIIDGEFTAIHWLTLRQARSQDLPSITRIILEELEERLAEGNFRDPNAAVPFYFMRGARFHRWLL